MKFLLILIVCLLIIASPILLANNNSTVFAKPRHSSLGQFSFTSTSSQSNIKLTAEVLQCYNSSSSALIDQWVNQLAHIGKPAFTANHTLFEALDKSLVGCFAQANNQNVTSTIKTNTTHPTTTTTTIKNKLHEGTFLTPGQLTVTGVKHPPVKHSAAYNIGYKLGTADGKIGGAGLPDGLGACKSGTGINGTATTNQCLSGYFAAWNKYCLTLRYGCNS